MNKLILHILMGLVSVISLSYADSVLTVKGKLVSKADLYVVETADSKIYVDRKSIRPDEREAKLDQDVALHVPMSGITDIKAKPVKKR